MIRVQGDVLCTRPGVAGSIKLKAGSFVRVADTLESGKESRLQMLLSDNSVINMSAGTVLRINQYSFERGKSRRTAVVSIKKGKARFILHEARKDGSLFRIETGNALIQTSTADLVVEVGGQQTGICTLSGNVGAHNSSNLVIGNVRLSENTCSIIREKAPPSAPSLLSPQQRRSYIRDGYLF
ncbi:MAG: FecR family protein [Pedobacter sp.]